MRWGAVGTVAAAIGAAVGLLAAPGASDAAAQDLPDPADVVIALVRQVCEQQWIEGVCEATGHPDPQYRTGTDPSPGRPLELRIGAVHEHSGYSDGDPDSRPSDYFRAGREGHNEDRDGHDTGVIVDFMLASEHSDNEKLPVTTAEACLDPSGIPEGLAAFDLEEILPPLKCANVDQPDHYRKWAETLAQAVEATDFDPARGYTGFTAMRGFEWTNDYYNHVGVYFSRNVTNVKVDLGLLTLDLFWEWLRRPPEKGGGADALIVFNHPGGMPALTPFDGGLPHGELLQALKGGANWNDLAYVPGVDERVVGIEVNGGDDLDWYVKALTNGWHLGPVAAEDEHRQEWSSSTDGKTAVLTRGRSPRDYYFALQNHRTIAVGRDLLAGDPGQPVRYPAIHYWADGTGLDDPAATVLGGTVAGAEEHELGLDVEGLPPGSPVVLVGRGRTEPVVLGAADANGRFEATYAVAAPARGEDWWFVVACLPGTEACGRGEAYAAVTAPIWVTAAVPSTGRDGAAAGGGDVADDETAVVGGPVVTDAGGGGGTARLPATGGRAPGPAVLTLVLLAFGARTLAHRTR